MVLNRSEVICKKYITKKIRRKTMNEKNPFDLGLIDKYFKIKSPIRNTSNIIEANSEYLEAIYKKRLEQQEKLKQKYNVDDPILAEEMEIDALERDWKLSQEAFEYISLLNDYFSGKRIKFYYSDPMLYYLTIDHPDCDHITVYDELCESIKLIEINLRMVPMIITKEKNYSLFDMVDLWILDNE